MLLSEVSLLASCWTTAGNSKPTVGDESSKFSLRDRMEVAASVGWRGFGILHPDLMRAQAEMGWKGLRALIASCDFEYIELEMLNDWFANGETRIASDLMREDLLHAANELGAMHIKVGSDGSGKQWSMDLLTNEFNVLCEAAESAGTRIALEPMPFTQVRDIAYGVALVDRSGHRAGGLIIDLWHVVRSHTSFEVIRQLPKRYIFAVEIDDANNEMIGDLFTDTLDYRRLPGEGECDIPGFINAIQATGFNGPWGVEILSNDQRSRTLSSEARLAYVTTMWQFYLATNEKSHFMA
jgi:sugar phosphate isomerase/epimerase